MSLKNSQSTLHIPIGTIPIHFFPTIPRYYHTGLPLSYGGLPIDHYAGFTPGYDGICINEVIASGIL